MAINNQEPNEIYPVQTFLKEEMLKDTNVLKELDQKKKIWIAHLLQQPY